MLQEIISAMSVLTMEKPKTPLFLAIKLYQIYNQSEGKFRRTVEWYEHRIGMLKAAFGPDFPMGRFGEAVTGVIAIGVEGGSRSPCAVIMATLRASSRPWVQCQTSAGGRPQLLAGESA